MTVTFLILLAYGFESPSKVQQYLCPLAVKTNSDALVVAETGTGKTAAYAIPLVHKIQPELVSPQAIVVVPTREQAMQISKVILALGEYKNIKVHTCIGGTSVRQDMMGCSTSHVIVGTCGRILDMIRRGSFVTSNIKMLVVDEYDEFIANTKDQLYDFIVAMPTTGNQIDMVVIVTHVCRGANYSCMYYNYHGSSRNFR